MANKILVAIDDSENAMRAVEFVANSFTADNQITLFNVVQDTAVMCEMNSPELTPYFTSQQSSFCLLEEKKKELVITALEKSKKIL
jgi:nucleotide-binding universal stress UspA family protein